PQERLFWNNLRAMLQAGDLTDVGVGGLVEATHDGDGNQILFRITEGYTTLMNALAAALDVRLNCPVSSVEWTDTGVAVTTGAERYEAEHVVITLPLAILQAGDVAFDPPLPPEKIAAANGLGAGP